MDADRFDEITIALSGHRRTVLRALLAGAAGALLGRSVGAGGPTCKAPGQACKKAADCCATKCKKKRGKRTGKCKACAGGAAFCGELCCQPGEDCVGGFCTCSVASCPDGCCGGGACVAGTTDAQCGTNGGACAACAAGQRCLNGACACDDQSCAGCCAGTTCVPVGQQGDGQCGTGGAACAACGACRTCNSGACALVTDGTACGTGGACDDGRCFRAFPNCDSCGEGSFAPAAGGNGVNFCTPGDFSPAFCAGQPCTQTADCPEGQWCAALSCPGPGTGNRCLASCPA